MRVARAWIVRWAASRRAARRVTLLRTLRNAPDGMTTTALSQVLGRRIGTLHPDLAYLEQRGLIDSHWQHNPGVLHRRRIYRLRQEGDQ